MAPIDNAYTDVWRGVLRQVLDWPDTKLEFFIARWQAVQDFEGLYSLTHDWPESFVVPLCVPESLRADLRRMENHELERLEIRLQTIVQHKVRSKQNRDDLNWSLVKKGITSALSEFGHKLPTADESFNYWFEHRIPGLDRDEADNSEQGD